MCFTELIAWHDLHSPVSFFGYKYVLPCFSSICCITQFWKTTWQKEHKIIWVIGYCSQVTCVKHTGQVLPPGADRTAEEVLNHPERHLWETDDNPVFFTVDIHSTICFQLQISKMKKTYKKNWRHNLWNCCSTTPITWMLLWDARRCGLPHIYIKIVRYLYIFIHTFTYFYIIYLY